jgi:hypothetical protein
MNGRRREMVQPGLAYRAIVLDEEDRVLLCRLAIPC